MSRIDIYKDRLVVTRGLRKGEMRVTVEGCKVYYWGDSNATLNILKPFNCIL